MKHWTEMLDSVEEWTRTLTSDAAESVLLEAGCPASVYQTISQSRQDPHVEARGSAVEVEDAAGHYQVANCPIQFTTAAVGASNKVPSLSQDTSEVLTEAGFEPSEIESLRAANVVG